MVQTSPRPAASILQALRIGKYLEGHLTKSLHAALFTPSPHYIHMPHSFWTLTFPLFLLLLQLLKCFIYDAFLTPLGLFGSLPSFPPIHIISRLQHTHLEIWLVQSHLLEMLLLLTLSTRLLFSLISYYCAQNAKKIQKDLLTP